VKSALAYVTGLRLAVFPVAEDCRRPLTPHGYKDAGCTAAEVLSLWAGRPNANVACATGAVSGVLVLDVDVKGANGLRTLREMEAANQALPRTWRTLTPSGGAHIWFRNPPRKLRNRVNFAPGLDVRTDGGSVALPPSRKANGPYTWEVKPSSCDLADAPGWLLALIDPPPVARPSPPIRVGSPERLARYATAAIDAECREVAAMAPNTGRNHRLFVAAARLGELAGAGVVPVDVVEGALETAAFDCGLTQEDGAHAVRATIRSGVTRGLSQPREVRA
jgi:hypothetical protein